ncbi:hypothetical protein TNCV_1522361 [Trichonephila clavipes]|nr:hypothetical protein TNCV_1522361 [Trichonephila clavipes]
MPTSSTSTIHSLRKKHEKQSMTSSTLFANIYEGRCSKRPLCIPRQTSAPCGIDECARRSMQKSCDGALSVLLLIVLLGFLWSQNGNSFQPT